MKPVIVVIAYNREDSLERLLASLKKADYDGYEPTLIISIDKSENDSVLKVANEFKWPFGMKLVNAHKERLGLKKHVLECSDNAIEYGSAIILEDDLTVSKSFYHYAVKALEFTDKCEELAGVSLYKHLFNVHVREPFTPIEDGSDGWYFQFTSSWGQAFTKKQWQGFREWLKKNDNKSLDLPYIPANVAAWGDNSWLKYAICYLVEEGKFFLYPQVSLSTNFSEKGTHSMGNAADLQVPLLTGVKKNWCFTELEKSMAIYDSFFENMWLSKWLNKEVISDLYGYRRDYSGAGYLISSKSLPYKVEEGFARLLRPHELNIYEKMPGEDFFLYNLSETGVPPKINENNRLFYNYRAFKAKYGLSIIADRIQDVWNTWTHK